MSASALRSEAFSPSALAQIRNNLVCIKSYTEQLSEHQELLTAYAFHKQKNTLEPVALTLGLNLNQ